MQGQQEWRAGGAAQALGNVHAVGEGAGDARVAVLVPGALAQRRGIGLVLAPPGGCHSSGRTLAADRAGRAGLLLLLRLRGVLFAALVVERVAARAALVTDRCVFFTARVPAFRVAAGVGIIALRMTAGRAGFARRATHLPCWSDPCRPP